MDKALKAYVDRAADPRLISGIYNYCDSRCERCPFTARCLAFRDRRDYEASHPEADLVEEMRDSYQRTFALLEAWCNDHGVDFAQLCKDCDSEESLADIRRSDEAIDADPLHRLARTYTNAAFTLLKSLRKAAPFNVWGAEVHEAVKTLEWYAGMVSAKIYRALHAFGEGADDAIKWDEIQNDWNGSAKVAHLSIAESRRAWGVLFDAGRAAEDAPVRNMTDLLDRIASDLTERFPRAMEFVRPGFDEPEVAAGALTSLACFEPRR